MGGDRRQVQEERSVAADELDGLPRQDAGRVVGRIVAVRDERPVLVQPVVVVADLRRAIGQREPLVPSRGTYPVESSP